MTHEDTLAAPSAVRLEGALTIVCAEAQRELLLGAVDGPQTDVVLDLSAIASFDSAGVQLLLAARRSLEQRGGGLVIENPAPIVADVLQTYGLQCLLARRAAA